MGTNGEPTFDETLGEYVAVTLAGCEVYGASWSECEQRLREANRVVLAHGAAAGWNELALVPDLSAGGGA